MTTIPVTSRPFCAGVFNSYEVARDTVCSLIAAGFPRHQIVVVENLPGESRDYCGIRGQKPAGTDAKEAAIIGAGTGATLGGASSLAVAAASTGIDPLMLVLSGAAASVGAIVGSLVGAMMTRGKENEPTNFTDQALLPDQIVVAVHRENEAAGHGLEEAAAVLSRQGAQPLPLSEG